MTIRHLGFVDFFQGFKNIKTSCFPLFSLEWTPIVLVMLIYIDYAMGFGNIPFILLGEILPHESCSLGNTLVYISTNAFRLKYLIEIGSQFYQTLFF